MSEMALFCQGDDRARELRDHLAPDDLSRPSADFIQSIMDGCEEELTRLQIEALKIADIIWDEISERRDAGEKPKLGVRVRRIKSTLQIVWYKNATSKAGVPGKITARQLNKGSKKKYRYDNSVFSFCPAWERDNAIMAEDMFATIRERASIVSEIRFKASRLSAQLKRKEG